MESSQGCHWHSHCHLGPSFIFHIHILRADTIFICYLSLASFDAFKALFCVPSFFTCACECAYMFICVQLYVYAYICGGQSQAQLSATYFWKYDLLPLPGIHIFSQAHKIQESACFCLLSLKTASHWRHVSLFFFFGGVWGRDLSPQAQHFISWTISPDCGARTFSLNFYFWNNETFTFLRKWL